MLCLEPARLSIRPATAAAALQGLEIRRPRRAHAHPRRSRGDGDLAAEGRRPDWLTVMQAICVPAKFSPLR